MLVNNNSTDASLSILKKYDTKVNISFWNIKENYNCYKMCGWKQQILEFYGVGHKFLMVDSDELFIYKDYDKITFENYWSEADSVVNEITWTNSMYAGKTMLEIQEMDIDPKANLHSTYILRNLFKIIRDTDIWDEQVKSKTMMKLADKERRRILAQLKKNYRNLTLQDEFEVICEFIELIEKKS